MARTSRERAYDAYRDAMGMILAARRGDEDAVTWMLTWRPALKAPTTDAFVAIVCALMREVDVLGGDADSVMRRWAVNLSDKHGSV